FCSTTCHADFVGSAGVGAAGTGATGSCPPTTGVGGVGAGAGVGTTVWAIGCAVACGICSLGENHVGVPGSAARGARGAHDGTCIGAGGSLGVAGVDSGVAAGPGAHNGRAGVPGWAGMTGACSTGWAGGGAGGVGITGAGEGGVGAATGAGGGAGG